MVNALSFNLSLTLIALFYIISRISAFSVVGLEARADSCQTTSSNSNPDDDSNNKAVILKYSDEKSMVCDATQKTHIVEEIRYAIEAANAAKADFSKYGYDAQFFESQTRGGPDWKDHYTETLTRITQLLDGTSTETGAYSLTVKCDNSGSQKSSCVKKETPAFVTQNSETAGDLTFCPTFFDPSKTSKGKAKIEKTSTRLETCKNDGDLNLRDAQRSGSAVLIHECIHTTYTMRGGSP